MPFLTRPHFEDRQIVQYVEESIELSGLTKIAPTLLYENPFNTGQTSVTIMGVNGYLNEGVNGREYGFMVQPPILKLSGSTGYTTTDVTGYVLKALDSGGTVTWAPISVSADTNTFVTGGTLNGTKLDLTWNTGGSVPSIDLSSLSDVGAFTSTTTNNRIIPTNTQGNVVSSDKSSILGGDSNTINTNSARSIIVGGRGNTVEGEYSFIGNGLGNSISGRGFWNTVINGDNNDLSLDPSSNYNTVVGNSHSITGTSLVANSILGGQSSGIYTLAGIDPINSTIVGGNGNSIYGPDNASIIGGDNNLINGEANNTSIIGGQNNNILLTSTSSFIGGGENNTLSNTTNSTILGGQNITGTTDDTTYLPNLTVRNDHILHSNTTLEVSDIPSSLETIMKGSYTEFNWTGLTSNIISNNNPSGYTSIIMGDLSNFPTTKPYGFITYFNSGYTRTGTPPTGLNFYSNKLTLKASEQSDGTIFANNNPTSDWWWENDGSSRMKLTNDGYLGLGLNPDGSETPTTHLQVGGTGTTGTFKFLDGNQSNGYVLTSDANGVGSWAASAGGGGGIVTGLTTTGTSGPSTLVSGTLNVPEYAGGGGGATIDPYQDEGNVNSITWDVSGTSTNYEATLTGVTTLTMSNVRNGDYGTLIVTQDGTGSRTLSFAGGTHKVVNGGGGAPTLTTTAGATDILSFTYNGTNFYWTVGNDYT